MSMNITNFLNFINNIEGWLTSVEQVGLIHIPQAVEYLEGAIVEIGSYKGKSTICLGIGSLILTKKKKPVFAIDPFKLAEVSDLSTTYGTDYFEEFWDNVQKIGLQNSVKPIRKLSTEAYEDCPSSISAIFVDGDHSYEGVSHDIKHYGKRVVQGGIIAFHDYTHSENVKRAVDELCGNSNFEYICDYDSLRLLRKIY